MKIAFFIEGNSKNPGGYNQVLNSVIFLSHFFGNKENFIFVTNDENLEKELNKLGINSEKYQKNLIEKFIDYVFGLKFLFNFLVYFNLKHSFAKFLKKQKIKLIFFLSPSVYATFCDDINFVINIWDVDHKKNSPFPEHKQDYVYEKRENYLNIVLFKAFKIIVPHEENKNELIKFYNIPSSKITIQTFIPYLPNMDTSLYKSEADEENYELQKIKKKKIVLYPATFWAHKNHNYIIEAAKIMAKENTEDFHFVMTGSDRGNLNHVLKLINSQNLGNFITVLPLISNSLLKKLYQECFAVIMPTDSGPTNLPLYEAMYFKKPIFYSNKMDSDKELKEIIFSIDLSDVYSFTEKLKNISKNNNSEIKITKGFNYYNKYCKKESLHSTYKSIIAEFNTQYSKWNEKI